MHLLVFVFVALGLSARARSRRSSEKIADIASEVKKQVKQTEVARKQNKKNRVRTLVETRKCRCEPCSTGLGPLQEVQVRMLKGQLHNQQGYILKVRKRLTNLLTYLQKNQIQ